MEKENTINKPVELLNRFCENGGISFSENEKSEICSILKSDPLIFFSSLERCLSNYYRKLFAKDLINHTQFLLMIMLYNEQNNFSSIEDFSSRMFFDRSTINRNTSLLIKKGYVTFNPINAKSRSIKLTKEGEDIILSLIDSYKEIFKENIIECFLYGMDLVKRGCHEKISQQKTF